MSVEKQLLSILIAHFNPISIEIINESHKHAGHPGSPGTGDTHFCVTIVSKHFEGLSKVSRHRLVYDCLRKLMNNPIHALSIKTFTEEEFNSLSQGE